MENILILFGKYDRGELLNPRLRPGFEDFYEYAKKKGIKCCRSSIDLFDAEKNIFQKAQFFENGEWIWKKAVKPDLVYDKTPFYLEEELVETRLEIERKLPFVNNLKLSELLSNKWLTYKRFSDFSPKTVLIEKEEDLQKINELESERVILKPITGSGGDGIEICKKSELQSLKFPFLVQELISTKKGIPRVVEGAHDLRVVIHNEKPIYSFVRIPPQGELIANLSRGGQVKVVDLEELPNSVLALIEKVSAKLTEFPSKFYSIDMMVDDNQKAWIIEMNSRPGITLEKEERIGGLLFWNELVVFLKHQ